MKKKHSRAYNLAKQFFEQEYDNTKVKKHSEYVVDCCHNIIQNTDLNPTVFDIGGWLHDIGRKVTKKKHHKIGLLYLDSFLQKNPEYKPLETEISDCILNHRKHRTPETVYGKVIQLADKLSKKHVGWKEYINQTSTYQKIKYA